MRRECAIQERRNDGRNAQSGRNAWDGWVALVLMLGLGSLAVFPQDSLTAQPRTESLLGDVVSGVALRAMPEADTTQSTRLASITTDTGDFAPGHQDFTRYTTPGLCHAAVFWTKVVLRRSLAAQADSLKYLVSQDTVGAAGVASIARACSARVPAAAAAADLPGMIQLAVDQQDFAQARTLLARFLAQHPSAFTRRLQIDLVDYSLTEEHPANVAAATAIVAQLDSLDVSAVGVQLTAHLHLLDFWQRSADSTRIRHEVTQILNRAHEIPLTTLRSPGNAAGVVVDSAVLALIRLDWWAAPDSLLTEIQRFCQAELIPANFTTVCGHATLAELTPFLIGSRILSGSGQLASGIPSGRIRADFWFPAPGGDTVVPARGKISLLVFPDPLPSEIFDPTRNSNDPTVGVMRETVQRWVAHYGAQGLQVTALAVTHGHASLRGLQPPAEEAQTIQWYVQNYLRMPVTVAVLTTPVHRQLPPPDGRIVWENDNAAYGAMALYIGRNRPTAKYVLIDQTGDIVVAADNPSMIEEGIKMLLSAPPAASSPQSSHKP